MQNARLDEVQAGIKIAQRNRGKQQNGKKSWHPVPSLHGKQMGKKMETVTDFIFFGSQITVDGDCSHEIKRRLPLGRKAMKNLDSILKSRDIMLLTKVHIIKARAGP